MRFDRTLLVTAALFGAAGVALAALGSHAADPNTTTAATFLQLHAAALVGLSLLPRGRLTRVGPWIIAIGTLLFAGDLLARSHLGTSLFPMAAPIGGGGMVVGWALVAAGALLSRRDE